MGLARLLAPARHLSKGSPSPLAPNTFATPPFPPSADNFAPTAPSPAPPHAAFRVQCDCAGAEQGRLADRTLRVGVEAASCKVRSASSGLALGGRAERCASVYAWGVSILRTVGDEDGEMYGWWALRREAAPLSKRKAS